MSCQNCDLPLIPGEPRCANCGYPVPPGSLPTPPKTATAFPSGATVHLAQPPYRKPYRSILGRPADPARGGGDGGRGGGDGDAVGTGDAPGMSGPGDTGGPPGMSGGGVTGTAAGIVAGSGGAARGVTGLGGAAGPGGPGATGFGTAPAGAVGDPGSGAEEAAAPHRQAGWGAAFGDVSLSRHRPAGFPSSARWLLSGATRNRRGLIVALLAAWSNLPVAVLLGTAGALGGAVAGFQGISPAALGLWDPGRSVSLGSVEAGGTFGLFAGGLVGALEGFLSGLAGPWWAMYGGDAFTVVALVVGQVLVGLVIGVGYLLLSVGFEGALLRARGARRLSRREAAMIMPIVNESAEWLRIESLPVILLRESSEANAFAGARHVVISRGLLEEYNYDREIVAGVVGHQLTHWNNADPVAGALARGVALPLFLAYAAAATLMRAFPHPLVRLLTWTAGWPVLLLVKYLVVPMQGPDQRAAEYRADQGAVLSGHRDGLRRFLVRAGVTMDGGRSNWDNALGRTHPAPELRLEALEERGKAYRLPDREAAPRPLPIEIISSRTDRRAP